LDRAEEENGLNGIEKAKASQLAVDRGVEEEGNDGGES